jgi:mono/diheme cytochrome c family protein
MYKNFKPVIPALALLVLAACESGAPMVSFKSQVKPILDANCLECHTTNGPGTLASGLDMTSYETLMKGTKYGPVIVEGNAESSTFYRLIAGKVDPSIRMPHGKEKIADDNIALIENWIQQGAKNN